MLISYKFSVKFINDILIIKIYHVSIQLVEASMRTRMSERDKAPSFARPSRPREPYANRNLSIHGSGNTKVDAWEKVELLKIQKRYTNSFFKAITNTKMIVLETTRLQPK